MDRARLWTLPAEPPPLLATAVSVETAAFAGEWADGLITINQPREHLERMLAAPREHGGEGKPVRPEDMHGPVLISSDLARHAAWIADFADAGFDAVYLHHVGREQQRFIAAFGEHVLPAL